MSGEQRVWENATVDDSGNVVMTGTLTIKNPDGTTAFTVTESGPDPVATGPTGPAGADGAITCVKTVTGIDSEAAPGVFFTYAVPTGKVFAPTHLIFLVDAGAGTVTVTGTFDIDGNFSIPDCNLPHTGAYSHIYYISSATTTPLGTSGAGESITLTKTLANTVTGTLTFTAKLYGILLDV